MQASYRTFLETECGFAAGTVKMNVGDLYQAERWLASQGRQLDAASVDDLRAYLMARGAEGVGASRILRIVSTLRGYFKFIGREDVAKQLEGPRPPQRLPEIPNVAEVARMLDSAAPLRDSAILETLYATGIRANELCEARVGDLDFGQRTLRVFGKGRVERIVPVSRTALSKMAEYLLSRGDLRPTDLLVTSAKGNRLTNKLVWHIVHRYAKRSKQRVNVSPHTLRHCFATHLLCTGKANLRQIQAWLGHSRLDTTAVYLNLDPTHLKRVHTECHPRERAARGLPGEVPVKDLKHVA